MTFVTKVAVCLILFCLSSGPAIAKIAHASRVRTRTLRDVRVTFYCGGCDPSRRTRTGKPWSGSGVAVGPDIPLGSRVRIEGYPQTFIADDTGGNVGSGEIDVRRHTRRCRCRKLGVQRKDVRYVCPRAKKGVARHG